MEAEYVVYDYIVKPTHLHRSEVLLLCVNERERKKTENVKINCLRSRWRTSWIEEVSNDDTNTM